MKRDTPGPSADITVSSGGTVTVTFRIENNNLNTGSGSSPTKIDESRSDSGTCELTLTGGLTVETSPPAPGTWGPVASGSATTKTWTIRAPAGPTSGTITLAATVTAVDPAGTPPRALPISGDQLSASATYQVTVSAPVGDTTPPTGSITINGGAAYTNTVNVTLNLSATDAVGVTGYRLADGTDASAGTIVPVDPPTTSFTADVAWTLPSGDGTKTVAVQYCDAHPNWSANFTASILLDTTPPTITIDSPTEGAVYLLNQVVVANWTATDSGSGIGTTTATVESGANIDTGTVGAKIFTVTATDKAGNFASLTVHYTVKYGFKGLLAPYVAPPRAYKINSSIPLKWQYMEFGDNVVPSPNANPSVIIKPLTLGDTPVYGDPIEIVEDAGKSGYQYDTDTMMWQFNWQTKLRTAGIYGIWITSSESGQTDGPFQIQLR